mmetsp:Transcript_13650/g.22341  ORF Transcript_13650/g.22341 Transcript_13650/m.22341 type:complete len:150 (-) Transcript_13650:665-1114(-)
MDLSPRDTGDVSGGRDSGVKSVFKNNNVNTGTCVKCRGLPDAGGKLRSCSACQAVKYCSRTCQVADWRSYHKRFCARFAAERKDALAVIGGAGHGPDSAKKLLDASGQPYNSHPMVRCASKRVSTSSVSGLETSPGATSTCYYHRFPLR